MLTNEEIQEDVEAFVNKHQLDTSGAYAHAVSENGHVIVHTVGNAQDMLTTVAAIAIDFARKFPDAHLTPEGFLMAAAKICRNMGEVERKDAPRNAEDVKKGMS